MKNWRDKTNNKSGDALKNNDELTVDSLIICVHNSAAISMAQKGSANPRTRQMRSQEAKVPKLFLETLGHGLA